MCLGPVERLARDTPGRSLGQVGLLLADEKKLIRSADFSKQQFQADKTIIDSQENALIPRSLFLLLISDQWFRC